MNTEAGVIEKKPLKERSSNHFEAMMEILICRPKASSTYKCRKCGHLFTGGYGKIRCHFLPIPKGAGGILDTGIRINECTASTDPTVQPNRFLERQIISEFRQSESIAAGAKRAREASIFEATQPDRIPPQALKVQAKTGIEIELIEFIADCDLSPDILDKPSFRNYIKAVQRAGMSYELPYPVALELNGSLLNSALEVAKEGRSRSLRGVDAIGGTIVSDGAKHPCHTSLNTALQLPHGSLLIQSIDTTSIACKTSEYLLSNIEKVPSIRFNFLDPFRLLINILLECRL